MSSGMQTFLRRVAVATGLLLGAGGLWGQGQKVRATLESHVVLAGGVRAGTVRLEMPQVVIGEAYPGESTSARSILRSGFLAGSDESAPLSLSSGVVTGLPATYSSVKGIWVSDEFSSMDNLQVALSVSNGTLTVAPDVAGGVTQEDIFGNGTTQVVLQGTGKEINRTLQSLIGVLYRSSEGDEGSDALMVSLEDPEGLIAEDSARILVRGVRTYSWVAASWFPGAGPDSGTSSSLLPLVIGTPDAFDAAGSAVRGRFGYVPRLEDDPLLWVRSGTIRCFKETPTKVDLISVSAAMIDAGDVTLSLSASYGSVSLSSTVEDGLVAAGISGNGTHHATVTAGAESINATLMYPGGLLYRGDLNFIGPDVLEIRLADGHGTEVSDLVSILVTGSSMDGWLRSYFPASDLVDPTKELTVWGCKADPDGDGRDNLMEYALGLDPTDGQDAGAGVRSDLMSFSGERYLLLTFSRRIDDGSLTYMPEVSGNGTYWSSGSGFTELIDRQGTASGWEEVTYRDLVAIFQDAPRFMRLKVIKNVAPVAGEDFAIVPEDGSVVVSPLFNDMDGDGDRLHVESVGQPGNGSVIRNADGTLIYIPEVDFHGTDSFEYVLADPHGGRSDGTVTVVVKAVQDGPSAQEDSNYTYEVAPVLVDVLANDLCADGRDGLRVLSVSEPRHGTLSRISEGVFRYTADPGYLGLDEWSYVAIAVGNSVYDVSKAIVNVLEWVDADGDRMADHWEEANGLSTSSSADGMEDTDGDGVPNLYEFIHKTDPRDSDSWPGPTLLVNGGSWKGGDGSPAAPFHTIQDALDRAAAYEVIEVAPGVYRGPRNRDLTPGRKPVLLRSASGAAECVVDAERQGRGFVFASGEDERTVVRGFVVMNGSSAKGGGVYCLNSSPVLDRCVIMGNESERGAGVYSEGGSPRLRNCTVIRNGRESGEGIYAEGGEGIVRMVNSIIWGNASSPVQGVGQVEARHCLAEVTLPGTNNLAGDPVFVSWSPYHLGVDSPCIDMGEGEGVVWPDVDGERLWDHPRRPNVALGADIGADEYFDADGDALSDAEEAVRGTRSDMADSDGDGFDDGSEVALGVDPIDIDSFPITISGTVVYEGELSGITRVRCMGAPLPLEKDYPSAGHVLFGFGDVPTLHWYSVDAYLDVNENGQQDPWEPEGRHSDRAVYAVSDLSGVTIWLSECRPSDLFAGDQSAQIGSRNPFLTSAQPVLSAVHQHTHGLPASGYAIQFGNDVSELMGEGSIVRIAPLPNGIRSLDIPYSGPILSVGMKVYWRIRFYDANGIAGPWSTAGANWFTYIVDDDGDEMADDWEAVNGVASGAWAGVMDDPDSDGFGNVYEFYHQTDPTSVGSRPVPTLFVNGAAEMAGDGTDLRPFKTIQEALDAAHDYDIIEVAAGEYKGAGNRDLDFRGKPVMVTSASGRPTVVLNCEGGGRGVFFHRSEDERAVLRGLVIEEGRSAAGGGGAFENSGPTLENMLFTACRTWGDGGGLWLWGDSRPRCRNVLFRDNLAVGSGGAIYAGEGASVSLVNCSLSGNAATEGGGLFQAGAATASTVVNSILWGNVGGSFNVGARVSTESSIVEGGWVGEDVVSVDPRLTRRGLLTGDSPCIDWGSGDWSAERDLDEEERWDHPTAVNRDGYADVGADEVVDTDSDGLADAWEREHFGGLAASAAEDSDQDGLTNREEYEQGTDPTRADTDGDGIPDGYELASELDPLDETDGERDPDGDGLTNAQEYAVGTDCQLADTDGDDLPDAYELKNGLNPLVGDDAEWDGDGDGMTNRTEYGFGTSPTRFDNLLPPIISPASGTFVGMQHVTIANQNPIGRIHYSTDGSEPIAESPILPAGQSIRTGDNGLLVVKARTISLSEPPGPVATAMLSIRPRAEPAQHVYLGWVAGSSEPMLVSTPDLLLDGKYLDLGMGWIVGNSFAPDLSASPAEAFYGEIFLGEGDGSYWIGGFTCTPDGLSTGVPRVLLNQGLGWIRAQGLFATDDTPGH